MQHGASVEVGGMSNSDSAIVFPVAGQHNGHSLHIVVCPVNSKVVHDDITHVFIRYEHSVH